MFFYQILLLQKYTNLLFIVSIFNSFVILILFILKDLNLEVNIFLILAIENLFILGPLYSDMFSNSERETKTYLIFTWVFRRIFIAKIIALTLAVVITYLVFSLVSFFLYGDISIKNFTLGLIYIVGTLPYYILFGTMTSVSDLISERHEGSSFKLLSQLSISVFAPLPFFGFYILMENLIIYIVFCFTVIAFWYFFTLKSSINKINSWCHN